MGNRVKIIAHRGASKEAPENTMLAFKRALEIGADGIELDIVLTKDRVPVVTHNDDISILTNKKGKIHKLNFSDIKTLDVGSHFDPELAGQTIPTLAEVIELVKIHPIKLYIELKKQPIHGIENVVGGLIQELQFTNRCVVCSFSIKILRNLKKHFPFIRRGLISKRRRIGLLPLGLAVKLTGASEVLLYKKLASPANIEWACDRDLGISFWTVDDATDILRVAKLKPEAIFTNDPALAKEVLKMDMD